MKKLISLMLTLVLILSVVPVGAVALSIHEFAEVKPNPDVTEVAPYVGITHTGKEVNLSQSDYETLEEQYKAYLVSQEEKFLAANHDLNKHTFNGYGSNSTYHWLQCACGCKINVEPHVDPLDTDNDYCICGYHFSDNAQLVTLWLKDCKELKNFRKDVYEYETDAYAYKDVTELKRISTRTFDSEATVELPEDLTLKEGENKIEIKVTAENKKVTQVYTVIVNKEAGK